MNQYNLITEEQKEQIKLYYFTKGYGQDATARKVGVSRSTVRRILNNEPAEVWYTYWGMQKQNESGTV